MCFPASIGCCFAATCRSCRAGRRAQFLKAQEIGSDELKSFLLTNAERVKAHAQAMAAKHKRAFQYLSTSLRKEDAARQLAERDGIEEGFVCVFSVLEPCRTFSFRFAPAQAYAQSAKRKCLHLYYYFMDRDLGLIHVRVQTWFPLQIQVYLNGHERLARPLCQTNWRRAKLAVPRSITCSPGSRTFPRRSAWPIDSANLTGRRF